MLNTLTPCSQCLAQESGQGGFGPFPVPTANTSRIQSSHGAGGVQPPCPRGQAVLSPNTSIAPPGQAGEELLLPRACPAISPKQQSYR